MIQFLIGFIVVCAVLAVVVILARWLLGLAGLSIPQPLAVAMGIVIFLILFLMLVNYTIYPFGGHWGLR